MKKLTTLCALVLIAGVIPNAMACDGKKMKRSKLEPVREYRVEESVTFRPYTHMERTRLEPVAERRITLEPIAEKKIILEPVGERRIYVEPVTRHRAFWVPGHFTSDGCMTWIPGHWR